MLVFYFIDVQKEKILFFCDFKKKINNYSVQLLENWPTETKMEYFRGKAVEIPDETFSDICYYKNDLINLNIIKRKRSIDYWRIDEIIG